MNYKNIFENLKTVRDFKKTKVEKTSIEAIRNYGTTIELSEGKTFQIVEIDGVEGYKNFNGKIGYYGKLIEAPLYLAIVGNENDSLKDVGYFTEALRLKIQDLGLGSCWISLDGSNPIFLDGKRALAIIAVGEIYNGIFKKDIQARAERKSVSDLVFDKKWGNEITWETLNSLGLEDVFYYARFAPSWGNIQPWKFIVDDSKIYLLIESDPNKSYELEAGIITLFFEKACIAAGYTTNKCATTNDINLGQPENYKIHEMFTL